MLTADPAFVWFPCGSYAEWATAVSGLEDTLRYFVPDLQRLLFPDWADGLKDVATVVFHLGPAIIVVENLGRLGWYVSDSKQRRTYRIYPEPDEIPVGLVWVIRDDQQPLFIRRPRDEMDSLDGVDNQIPLEDLFPDGLIGFVQTYLPAAQPCFIWTAPEETLGLQVASWHIPYPQPDISACLPFVVDTVVATSPVHGLVALGETTPQTHVPVHGSCHFLSSFDWEQRAGAPAPVLAAKILAQVWCVDDWTATPPVWEAASLALLAQPLGNTTRLAAFGDAVTGPFVAAALDPVLVRELDAQRRWNAPVLLPVLSGSSAPLTGKPSHSIAQLRPRDHEMMELYRAGKTHKEIAEHLGLRPTYVQRRLTELRRLFTLPYRNKRAAERARQRWHERERPLPQPGKKMPTDGKKK